MARQTRAQRRARRAQRSETIGDGAVAQPPAPVRQPPRPVAQEAPRPTSERQAPGTRFVGESWAELNKVEWPGQSQVIQATVVVLVACIVVGIYLWLNDTIWKPVVQWILGQ